MYFLVILICLTINYLWLKDLDRFNDSWFFRFQAQVNKVTQGATGQSAYGWLLPQLIIYALPLTAIAVLLFVLDGVFVGVLVMLVHILVLLVAFDRTQPDKLATDFLALWKQGDLAAAREYLSKELDTSEAQLAEADRDELAVYFSKQLTYRCFEKMFVVFFWYMVAGPLGVLFCYISYQLRDCNTCGEVELAQHSNRVLIRILEWVPMRLLVLSFSLAGNFVNCFKRLRQVLWDFSLEADYADLLYGFSSAALAGVAFGDEDSQTRAETSQEQAQVTAEIEALQALLERSQLIWLSVLALITVFGINGGS